MNLYLLMLVGLLATFTPVLVFCIERGRFGDPDSIEGDFIHWMMTKTPEQMFLMVGSVAAGISIVTAALMQGAWKL